MNLRPTSNPSVKQRLRHELHEYVEVSIYLFVCLVALLFYRFSLLEEEHQATTWRFGFAAGKALVLGKFILIGRTLRIGERHRTRTLPSRVIIKSLFFLVLLLALSAVEEMLLALIHGRPIAGTLSEGGTPLQIVASSVLMWLILIPYFAFKAFEEKDAGT